MPCLEQDAAGVCAGHLRVYRHRLLGGPEVVNRQPQELVARVAVGGLRSGVRLQDPPVAAPDEKDDVTRVLGEQLVPVQDCLRTLPLADVDECADGPADAAVLVAQRHAVSEQRAHRPIVVDGREFLIAYVDAGPGRGINGQVAGAITAPLPDSKRTGRTGNVPEGAVEVGVAVSSSPRRFAASAGRPGSRVTNTAAGTASIMARSSAACWAARSRVSRSARSVARQRPTCHERPSDTRTKRNTPPEWPGSRKPTT